ncbi:hypothetical protein DFH08DRAFT_863800 [Mycena albidolilacea]|uniref:Uncharacterized protein n=1 Tax=Mycena albidolilacea TaxID=1033008 RepID=A0AAD7A3R1_9AGAR|nr:hypothetical protein DFH08DRAFT_863800 [Mycena albidolilacea]
MVRVGLLALNPWGLATKMALQLVSASTPIRVRRITPCRARYLRILTERVTVFAADARPVEHNKKKQQMKVTMHCLRYLNHHAARASCF